MPIVAFQHFRGNLENWDPPLIDALAANRRVLTFDNTGVGATSGMTPHTIAEMAQDAIAFVDALELPGRPPRLLDRQLRSSRDHADPTRSGAARRARILGAPGCRRHARLGEGRDRRCRQAPGVSRGLPVRLLRAIPASQAAGKQSLQRIFGARTEDRDADTTWQTRQAQYDAVCSWGVPNHALLQRVSAIDHPVFIANGDSDPMILPHYSYLLAGLIPQARLKIYPDAAHGFLFQHAAEFAADVEAFLRD